MVARPDREYPGPFCIKCDCGPESFSNVIGGSIIVKKTKTPADVKKLNQSEAREKRYRQRWDFWHEEYAVARAAANPKQRQAMCKAKLDEFNAKMAAEKAKRKFIAAKHW
jgi:hypothetical protein